MAGKGKMIDPVCGMEVGADTQYKAGFQGQTYYFCNEADRKEFQDRPEVYARKMQQDQYGRAPEKNDPNA